MSSLFFIVFLYISYLIVRIGAVALDMTDMEKFMDCHLLDHP